VRVHVGDMIVRSDADGMFEQCPAVSPDRDLRPCLAVE
jgi:hypothetical protein